MDLRYTDKSRYFAITEFFAKKKQSVVKFYFTHERKIICSQTHLDDVAHEQTIICRQLLQVTRWAFGQ